jgi:hypothetical protein
MTFLLLAGVSTSLQAQTLASGSPAFKVGDYVEVQAFSQWIPGRVSKLVLYGAGGQCEVLSATCKTVGAYIVSYIVNPASGPQDSMAAVTDVRARAATAGDAQMAAETAAALARQPHGNTVGAKYGTRDPRTCSSRNLPARGAPSAAQATQYVICALEQGNGSSAMSLVTNVKVQVAPVPHPANPNLTPSDSDPREPYWDIRGSFTSYICYPLDSLIGSPDFARTHNCDTSDSPSATGICYKNTFGDWYCIMAGGAINEKTHVLAPAGT